MLDAAESPSFAVQPVTAVVTAADGRRAKAERPIEAWPPPHSNRLGRGRMPQLGRRLSSKRRPHVRNRLIASPAKSSYSVDRCSSVASNVCSAPGGAIQLVGHDGARCLVLLGMPLARRQCRPKMVWRTQRVSHSLARRVGSGKRTESIMLATSMPDWKALLQRFRDGAARAGLPDQDRTSRTGRSQSSPQPWRAS